MKHDDLCQDDGVFINGHCLGCEAVLAIRNDTAYRIQNEMEVRGIGLSAEAIEILRKWQGEPPVSPTLGATDAAPND